MIEVFVLRRRDKLCLDTVPFAFLVENRNREQDFLVFIAREQAIEALLQPLLYASVAVEALPG